MQEAKQAVELIRKWETIDVADALELLSPDFESEEVSFLSNLCLCMLLVFLEEYVLGWFSCSWHWHMALCDWKDIFIISVTYPFFGAKVRAYAVNILERADDEELQCYLLQLVQALRFERSDESCLAHFLVKRGMFSCFSFFFFFEERYVLLLLKSIYACVKMTRGIHLWHLATMNLMKCSEYVIL